EISKLLSACDLMLLPFVDGISARRTSAVTALQHGLPLLTTRGNRLDALFVHGQNVYLVPCGDSQALARGLVELASRVDLRSRLSRGARATYDTHFRWELIARQVAGLVQDGSRC